MSDATRRLSVRLSVDGAQQAQHAALRGPGAGNAQPRPNLPVPLAMEGAVVEDPADRLHQVGISDRSSWTRAT